MFKAFPLATLYHTARPAQCVYRQARQRPYTLHTSSSSNTLQVRRIATPHPHPGKIPDMPPSSPWHARLWAHGLPIPRIPRCGRLV